MEVKRYLCKSTIMYLDAEQLAEVKKRFKDDDIREISDEEFAKMKIITFNPSICKDRKTNLALNMIGIALASMKKDEK